MDSSLKQILQEKGVGDQAITTLLREEICDMETFMMLKESHFAKLNERLSLGQHALLLKIWEEGLGTRCHKPSRVQPDNDLTSACIGASSKKKLNSPQPATITIGQDWSSLWKKYKEDQRGRVDKLNQKVVPAPRASLKEKKAMYHLGGMVYSFAKGKGVRKKYIPTPCEVEFLPSATLQDVLKTGKRKFFGDEEEISLSCLALADSSGSRIDIDNEDTWTIGDFYAQHDYKPSRYKLYVMYVPPSSDSEEELLNVYRRRAVPTTGSGEGTSRRSQNSTPLGLSNDTISAAVGPSPPPLVSTDSTQKSSVEKTKAVISMCPCGRQFYNFIPDTLCTMPNGTIVFYQQPQVLCPLCDDYEWGWQYNVSLFPEFKDRVPPTTADD